MSEYSIECWTDGSTIKHQGKGRGECGIGFAVTDGDHILFCGGEYIGYQTSNYAEFYAVLRCLEEVASKIEGEVKSLTIYSDSEVLVNGLNGDYNISSDNLVELVERIESSYDSLPSDPVYKWTRSHSGDKMNEFVDLLAYTCSTGYPYDD